MICHKWIFDPVTKKNHGICALPFGHRGECEPMCLVFITAKAIHCHRPEDHEGEHAP